MKRMAKTLMAVAFLTAPPALAETVDPAAIADLAENCRICHGPSGQGAGDIKAIIGRSAEALTPLLISIRDGKTPSTLMWRLMKPLTDAEIAALATEIATWK